MKKNLDNVPIVTPRLTFDQKETMLMHILRIPRLFTDAKRQLKSLHFDKVNETRYALLWQAALDTSAKSNGKLPIKGAKRRLELAIKSMLELDQDLLDSEQYGDLFNPEQGFIAWVYSEPDDELYEQDGRELLELFLRERMIIDPLKRYMEDVGEGNPINLPKMLRNLEQQNLKITSTYENPVMEAFPANWRPEPLKLTPTGLDFFDVFMGGQAGGEVYGILGGTGVGKSLVGLMLGVEGALYQQRTYSENETGIWYYVTYESPVKTELRLRALGYAAKVNRATLFEGDPESTTDNLKPYEKERFKHLIARGEKVPGEKERIKSIIPQLNKNLKFIDFSGDLSENPNAGSGGVEEIADYLSIEVNQNTKIAGIVIDYVKIAVERQMAADNVGFEQLRHYISGYGEKVKKLLAMKYNCPVWLLHQLTGEANSKAPTIKQHHSKAAEAKNFADNLWYCFNLSMKDQNTSCCLLSCSKERRSFSGGLTPILFIDGAIGEMRRADDLYTIEGNAFVLKEFKNKIAGPTNIKQSKKSQSPMDASGYHS